MAGCEFYGMIWETFVETVKQRESRVSKKVAADLALKGLSNIIVSKMESFGFASRTREGARLRCSFDIWIKSGKRSYRL
jgi:hypothetical protein